MKIKTLLHSHNLTVLVFSTKYLCTIMYNFLLLSAVHARTRLSSSTGMHLCCWLLYPNCDTFMNNWSENFWLQLQQKIKKKNHNYLQHLCFAVQVRVNVVLSKWSLIWCLIDDIHVGFVSVAIQTYLIVFVLYKIMEDLFGSQKGSSLSQPKA